MAIDTQAATLKLLDYCQAHDWAGYDPYDALNSRLLRSVPLLNSRLPRLALTQVLKRSPINIRPLLLVPPTQNPKALGLFLSSLLNLSKIGFEQDSLIEHMIERLAALRSADTSYWCWGYSFPWQTRGLLVPTGAPNLVCTTFVANSLLDAFEQRQDASCLKMAVSASEYLLNELFWESDGGAGFSYPLPELRNQIHNANFLAAALLCRVYKHTGDTRFLNPALAAARCSAAAQRVDGMWTYGEMAVQGWADNFHTGYNLCALRSIGRSLDTMEFEPYVRRGFDFYRAHFFREDGVARYFHNRTYPIDIHCVAQSIITLLEFQDLDQSNLSLAESVLHWAMDHMWDRRGFFYYRVLRSCTIQTSYMRWSQAWMLLAMTTLLLNTKRQVAPAFSCDRTSYD